MKRLLLAVLVALGLNTTQAQVNVCDSITVTGSQTQMSFQVNGINTFVANWETISHDSVVFQQDSMVNTITVFNYNPVTNLPYDTLTQCLVYGNPLDVCCVEWVWNSTTGMWAKMGMAQQPYFCCDSITYWTDQGQGLFVGLDTTNMVHNPDSMIVYWGVCTGYAGAGICYAGNGISDYFPQVTTSDTIKVGYDVFIYENGVYEVCNMEEWLIFDQNTYSWVLLNMLPTSINELTFNRSNDGKIYDLLGRELTEIPVGKLYIRNQKLYITR